MIGTVSPLPHYFLVACVGVNLPLPVTLQFHSVKNFNLICVDRFEDSAIHKSCYCRRHVMSIGILSDIKNRKCIKGFSPFI